MICVDTSVVVKWFIDEERSESARALYRAAVQADIPIVAPPLLPLELTNAFRKRMREANGIELAEALALLDEFLASPITIENPPGLHRQALVLATTHDLPATYDAHYLALAEHFGCDFWTDDQRLLRQVGSSLPFVRPLGEYVPTGF